MTNSEARILETDAIIFPLERVRDNHETNATEEQSAESVVEKQPVRADIKIRFARFKKSLRKRAAGIL